MSDKMGIVTYTGHVFIKGIRFSTRIHRLLKADAFEDCRILEKDLLIANGMGDLDEPEMTS